MVIFIHPKVRLSKLAFIINEYSIQKQFEKAFHI
jgi:hypothetical protein